MPEAEDKLKALQIAYAQSFESESGKKVLKDLENRYCVHKTTMDANPHFLAHNEGMRSVILYIKDQLKMNKVNAKELRNEIEGQS